MFFVFFAYWVSQKQAWSDSFLFMLVLSSMIPFGMVFMDGRIRAKAQLATG
jgi:hypothetical protein